MWVFRGPKFSVGYCERQTAGSNCCLVFTKSYSFPVFQNFDLYTPGGRWRVQKNSQFHDVSFCVSNYPNLFDANGGHGF